MYPAGSGPAHYRGAPGVAADDSRAPGGAQPSPHETRFTMDNLPLLLECAQRLVDTRPSGEYSAVWFARAAAMGDLGSLGAAATIAARSAPSVPPVPHHSPS
jgi:hypothetical protein